MEYKDYYAILGVPKNADEKTIKSAYRKLARAHHPDVNPDKPEAEQRFKEINEAYAVLSDEEKRKMYDRFGAEWEDYQRAGFGPNDAPHRSRPGGMGGGTRTMTPEEFLEVFGRGFGRRAPGGFSTSFGDSGGFATRGPPVCDFEINGTGRAGEMKRDRGGKSRGQHTVFHHSPP